MFAIPGSIHNPLSKGCHRLIREGATLTETAQDIVSELGGMLSFVKHNSAHPPRPQAQRESVLEHKLQPLETQVLNHLGFDYTDLDSLINRSGLSASELNAILSGLELRGLIDNQAGLYCRIS